MQFIVNPASAHGKTGKQWPAIEQHVKDMGMSATTIFTTGPGAATTLTREALRNGAHTIVAVGGDGSINEVVNGFFDEQGNHINPDAKLGIVTAGTGCDLVKSLAIPTAVNAALQIISHGHTRIIDLGLCEFQTENGKRMTRYFVNNAEVGIGGATVNRVNHFKYLGGFLGFMIGALLTTLSYRNTDNTISLNGDPPKSGRFNGIIAANGRYFGGGMQIAPAAAIDDGQFDIILLGDLSRLEVLANFPRIYAGTHIKHPKVKVEHARTIHITSQQRCLLDMDGEQPGQCEVSMRIIPHALQVIVP